MLNRSFRGDRFDPLTEDKLKKLLRGRKNELSTPPFSQLLQNLNKLKWCCGIDLYLKKEADNKFSIDFKRTHMNALRYDVEKDTVTALLLRFIAKTFEEMRQKVLKSGIQLVSRSKEQCPLMQIDIKDGTSADGQESAFYKVFSHLENQVYPTVIRYKHVHPDKAETKKLFVYRTALTASDLYEAYGDHLTRIRDQFYLVEEKVGAPHTDAEEMKANIQKAVRELCRENKDAFGLENREIGTGSFWKASEKEN